MRIKKELFNKLPQLDRIEYFLKDERLNKKYDASFLYVLTNRTFLILGFFILFILAVAQINIEAASSLLEPLWTILGVLLFLCVLGLFADIGQLICYMVEKRKLNEGYFKVEKKK